MIKKSRLSLRSSDELNDDIEKMVIIKRDVRDRSDLGNQSVEFLLDLIETKKFDEQLFLSAILNIANKAGKSDLPEIKEIERKLDWFNRIANDPITEAHKMK
ncbi:MAG: hypothetical protein ACXAE3_05930 [Candidatus Kariarchaeaceae archaeon]|jgi:hypothetical protein